MYILIATLVLVKVLLLYCCCTIYIRVVYTYTHSWYTCNHRLSMFFALAEQAVLQVRCRRRQEIEIEIGWVLNKDERKEA